MSALLLRGLALALAHASAAALHWLSVVPAPPSTAPLANDTRAFLIVDESNREVQLRGVNLEAEERSLPPPAGKQRPINAIFYANGSCPENLADYSEPPVCEVEAGAGKWAQDTSFASRNDLAQIRALGFNFIRLCLSWSELESVPGVYSTAYLDRVAQIVGWAKEQDVYVLLDMHEDLYSRSILGGNTTAYPPYLTPADGQDGAPAWAVLMDDWPSLAILGIGNLNLGMMKAFDNFWSNAVPPGNVSQGDAPGVRGHYSHRAATTVSHGIVGPSM